MPTKISDGQMTLGQMISRYEELGETMVENPGKAMSARAVYAHVGFDYTWREDDEPGEITGTQAAQKARDVVGKTFEGYKGGNFMMDERCPVWIAQWGTSGWPLLAIDDNGRLIIGGEGRFY